MRPRYQGYPIPKKPVVVGDMLFTNTSKRWISTANLREDMLLMKNYNGLQSAKRFSRQAHDYNMQVFKDLWARKLDRSRLTKPLSAKKEAKKKKEVAAYLRDVYSDSESDDLDTSTSDLTKSMASRKKKKQLKKRQSATDSMEQIEQSMLLAPLEEEESVVSYISERSSPASPYAMSSIASLTKYIPNEPETPIPEIPGKKRSIKSASFVHQPVSELPPPLKRKISKSTSLIHHQTSDVLSDVVQGLDSAVNEITKQSSDVTKPASVKSDDVKPTAEPEQPDNADVTADDTDITSVSQTMFFKPKPIDAYKLRGAFGLDKLKPPAPPRIPSATSTISNLSKTSMDSASYELSKMNLGPIAIPPIHSMKPRKPAVRPWDYPYAGVHGMMDTANLHDQVDSRENLNEQLADLKYCRYLRLPPGKYAKRKQLELERQRQARRKDTKYVVAAGRDFTEHDKRIIKLLTENAAGKWMKKSKLVAAVNPNIAAVAATGTIQEENK